MGLMRIWRRLAQPRPRIYLAALAMAILSLGAGVALLATSAWLIVRASERPAILTLTVAIVSVRFFGLSRPAFRYVERLLSHEAVLRSLGRIRSTMIDALTSLSPTHALFARRGEVISRLVGDVEKSQDYFLRVLAPVASAVAIAAMASGLEFLVDTRAGITMGAGLALTMVLAAAIASWAARRAATAVERGALSGAINELVRGAEELHMWQAADRELGRVLQLDRAVTAQSQRAVRGLGSGTFVIFAGLGATMSAIIPSALASYRAGSMAWPTLAVLVLLPLALLDVLLPLPIAVSLVPEIRASLNRIEAVTQTAPATLLAPGHLFGSDLVLDGVAASWDQHRDQIAEISLKISEGMKVAIVGPSGSGKTTLALVMAGLLPPTHGQALLGGRDVAQVEDEERSQFIAFAAQDSYVFNTSVRENLLIADPELTDDAMRSFLAAAGLDEWIAQRGLDFIVGENGAFLSGGQRRRLSIAQALAARRPVTIFDEPTAHLDVEGGDALLRTLFTSTDTRIVITHRLAPLSAGLADLIVVMEQGRIVEMGTHDELIRTGARYAALRVAESVTGVAA